MRAAIGREFQEERTQFFSVLGSASYNYILGRAKDSQAQIPTYSHLTVITIIIDKNNNKIFYMLICDTGSVYIYSIHRGINSLQLPLVPAAKSLGPSLISAKQLWTAPYKLRPNSPWASSDLLPQKLHWLCAGQPRWALKAPGVNPQISQGHIQGDLGIQGRCEGITWRIT